MAYYVGAQPTMQPGAPVVGQLNTFETPLCCASEADCSVCAAAVFCPCCVVGANAKMLANPNMPVGPCDGGGTECAIHGALSVVSFVVQSAFINSLGPLGTGFVWFCPCYSCTFCRKLRERFNIVDHALMDCVCHYFCHPCVLCQEHVELKKRYRMGQVMAMGGQPGMAIMMTQQHQHVVMGQPASTPSPYYPPAGYNHQQQQQQQQQQQYPGAYAPGTMVQPPPVAQM